MDILTDEQLQKAINGFLYRKKYYRQYQQTHKEMFNISSKKYFYKVMEDDQKRQDFKDKKKAHYEANKERINKYNKEYQEKHKEALKEYSKQYRYRKKEEKLKQETKPA